MPLKQTSQTNLLNVCLLNVPFTCALCRRSLGAYSIAKQLAHSLG